MALPGKIIGVVEKLLAMDYCNGDYVSHIHSDGLVVTTLLQEVMQCGASAVA